RAGARHPRSERRNRPTVARWHAHELRESAVQAEADLIEVLAEVRLVDAARVAAAAAHHVFDRHGLADADVLNVLTGRHDIARELVAEDRRKSREPGICDVAVGIGLEEMQIGSTESHPVQLDDHIVGTGLRRVDLLKRCVRVAPDAATYQRLARVNLNRRGTIVGARIPCSIDDERFHCVVLIRRSPASSSPSRSANTFAIASPYCSTNAGGWQHIGFSSEQITNELSTSSCVLGYSSTRYV